MSIGMIESTNFGSTLLTDVFNFGSRAALSFFLGK